MSGPRRPLVSVALLVTALAAPSAARAADAPVEKNPSPYQLKLEIDIPLFASAMAIWILPSLVVGNQVPGPACGNPPDTAPCDPAQLNALDRSVVGTAYPVARTVANSLFAVPAAFALIDILDGGKNWRGWLTDLVVVGEAAAINGALDEIVRRSVRRPRPYLYIAGAYPDDRLKPEATFSFYSGHSSTAFALGVSLAYTFHQRHPDSAWRYAVWATLTAAAAAEPVLRVLSGDHFPTDVLVGSLIGTSVGLIVPVLHRRKDLVPGVKALSLVPTSRDGTTMLSLSGMF